MHRTRLATLPALACCASCSLAAPVAPPMTAPVPSPRAASPRAASPRAASPRIILIDTVEPSAPSTPAPSTPSTPAPSAPQPSSPPAPSAPDAARIDEARRLGSRGLVDYDRHDYQAAIDNLTGAILLHDAPSLRLYRARAAGKLERWGAACSDYEAIQRAPVAENETPIAAQARAAALPEGEEACAQLEDASLPLSPSQGDATAPALPSDAAPPPPPMLDHLEHRELALKIEASFFGHMQNQVAYSKSEFDPFEPDSESVVGRVALSWYPLPAPARDWLGFAASWVQDYGTGQFDYTELLGAVVSQQFVGPWRFGARLEAGYLHSGASVLDHSYVVLEPRLEAGARFGDFSATASAALVLPIAALGDPLYEDYTGSGIEGRLALDYRLWRWLGLQLSGTHRRLEFDFDSPARAELPQLDDAPSRPPSTPDNLAVVDRYTTLLLSLTVNL